MLNDTFSNLLKLYTFEKKTVPDDEDDKEIFLEALAKYGVSLKQYLTQLETSRKRPNEDSPPEVRRSPRLSDVSHVPSHEQSLAKRSLFKETS